DGIGVGVAARAGYDPYGAARFLTSMGRNAELKSTPAQSHIDPRAPDFLSSHPATPERIKNAQASARQLNAPSAVEREKAAYLASIEGLVYGEDRSEGFVRGRRFLHPKLGFTFLAPEGFTLDNTAQAVLGVKESGGQALRLGGVRVPAEQTLAAFLSSGWVVNIDPNRLQELVINSFPAATAAVQGDRWLFWLFAGRLRHRRLSLHLRFQTHVGGRRPCLSRVCRHVSPHDLGREPGGKAPAYQDRDRCSWRHGRASGEPHGDARPRRRALSRAQRPWSARARERRRSSQDRRRVDD